MYLSTDGTLKSEINSVIDQIRFTFGVKPESVPYLDKYGVRINVVEAPITDTANTECTAAITNLGIGGLSVSSVTVDEFNRKVTVSCEYKETEITQTTNYTVGA